MKVLVVGASGFVGGHLVRRLAADGIALRAAVHRNRADLPAGIEIAENVDLEGPFDWTSAVAGCDTVAHLGARVHVAQRLASAGREVVGLDIVNDYYDPTLKEARLRVLEKLPSFRFVRMDLADRNAMAPFFAESRFSHDSSSVTH